MGFTCAILGEGALAVYCLEELVERGHRVVCAVSGDETFADVARHHGVPVQSSSTDLHATLGAQPFDVLFCIVWRTILPIEVLALARRIAVNYHDAPLPRFAGTHATPWALLEQADTYAVTWHAMTERVDQGSILEQRSVSITAGDTVRTLDLKCFDAAIESFRTLIDNLQRDALAPRPQDLAARTFYPRHRRPDNEAVIDWRAPAADIDALCRACAFGPSRPNDFALPKLYTTDGFLIVTGHQLHPAVKEAPGTIVAARSSGVEIAAMDGVVEIRGVARTDGTPISLTDATAAFGLRAGARLPSVETLQPRLGARATRSGQVGTSLASAAVRPRAVGGASTSSARATWGPPPASWWCRQSPCRRWSSTSSARAPAT